MQQFDDVHVEHLVVAFLAVAFFDVFALQFEMCALIVVEGSAHGAIITFQILRISVPPILDVGNKDEFVLVCADLFRAGRPPYRVFDLCKNGKGAKEE